MMVKVCGITRREDALAAAEAGASAIGFVFYPHSPRCITPERAAELGDSLGLWKVGIFVDQSPVAIQTVMRAARLDVAQIYGGEGPQGARVWKAFRLAGAFDSLAIGNGAEAVLLDSAQNGVPFDWSLARGLAGKVIVAGGLDAPGACAITLSNEMGVCARCRSLSASMP